MIDGVLVMWIIRETYAFISTMFNRNTPTMEEKHASNYSKISIASINKDTKLIE